MNDSVLEPAELVRAKLRAAIADVTVQMSELSARASGGDCANVAGTMATAWQTLVPLIQPEPEPERRACPHCQRRIIVAATRCKYCMEKSVPPSAEH
jgi:hypothetical protein